MGLLLDAQGVMIACRLTGGEVIREGALRFLHTLTNVFSSRAQPTPLVTSSLFMSSFRGAIVLPCPLA